MGFMYLHNKRNAKRSVMRAVIIILLKLERLKYLLNLKIISFDTLCNNEGYKIKFKKCMQFKVHNMHEMILITIDVL